MFETACIPMLISKATLKREMDDEEAYRVADIGILVEPFTPSLAAELGDHIVAHLFTRDGKGEVCLRPEVADITMSLRVPMQRVVVASAPDAPALATLESVRIGDLTVVRKAKGDREWYRATITARIDLRERVIREFLFHHFGEIRVFTFMDEQMGIPFEDATALGGASTSEARH